MKHKLPRKTKHPLPRKIAADAEIRAAAQEEKIITLAAEQVTIEAALGEGGEPRKGPRRFDVLAYTGGELHLDNFDLPVVLDVQGVRFTKSIKANLDHKGEQRVGHVTEKSKENNQIRFAGLASASHPSRDQVIASADDGYDWEASIEAKPNKVVLLQAGKTRTVNGQEFTGPKYIVRESIVRGFAFVSHGGDITGTEVNIAASAAKSN